MALPHVTFFVSNGNNIAASNYLHFAANDERQTSCHWKQSQLRVTKLNVNLVTRLLSHHSQLIIVVPTLNKT